MEYDTAVIVFRHGANDYSLWTVDLPRDMLREVQKAELVGHGELETVMENIPVIREDEDSPLAFLFRGADGVSLCIKAADEAFMEEHQHEGCSVRGDKELIMAEVMDLFQWQAPAMTM